jgi:hypothetical protein
MKNDLKTNTLIVTEHSTFEKNMGNIFYELINSLDINNIDSIVEFAPGFRSKISYALEKMNYSGTLYVIDSNEKVLEYIKETYSKNIPNAKIVPVNCDLKECTNSLPKEATLFLANHCFDDMIISKYIQMKDLDYLFDNNEDTYTLLNKCWLDLVKDDQLLNRIIDEVYDEISSIFRKVDFEYVIMNNYKSWFYFNINNIPEMHSTKVFNRLKNNFNIIDVKDIMSKIDFVKDEELEGSLSIEENILNPDNWIVGEVKDN